MSRLDRVLRRNEEAFAMYRKVSILRTVRDIYFAVEKKTGKIVTTVEFNDGSKTSAKNMEGDEFDSVTGIEQCLIKRFCGVSRCEYKRWMKPWEDKADKLLAWIKKSQK